MLQHVLDVVATSRDRGETVGAVGVVAVGDPDTAALLRRAGCHLVANDRPELGLSHSLRLGLGALADPARPTVPTAALIFLGDQPGVRTETVSLLVEAWRNGVGPVVRPRYAGAPDRPGHPLILERTLWDLTDQLGGDAGLGPLLRSRPELVQLVEVEGDNPDIDTRDDLNRFEARS